MNNHHSHQFDPSAIKAAALERKPYWLFGLQCAALLAALILGLALLIRNGRSAVLYWCALFVCLFFTPRSWLQNGKAVFTKWWALGKAETLRLSLISAISSLAASLAAYGFLFTNEFFSHDALTLTNYGVEQRWSSYVWNGRILIPLYEKLKGPVTAPWLIGLLFILYMSLTVLLLARLFELRRPLHIFLIGALFCTNSSLAMLGSSYIACMDDYALALLAAVAGAWFICRCRHGGFLGALCIAVSMGLYQAYLIVAAGLCFFSLFQNVTSNERLSSIVRRGLRYLGLMLAGFFLYFLTWSAACRFLNIEKGRMGDTIFALPLESLKPHAIAVYKLFFRNFFRDNGMTGKLAPTFSLLLLGALLVWLAGWLLDKRLAWGNKLLLCLMVVFLPFVFRASSLLLLMGDQSLVAFNQRLPAALVLLCAVKWRPAIPYGRRFRAAAAILALAIVCQNLVFSNQCYIKKDLEKNASLSIVTRIIERVEQLDGYVLGETPVAFSGGINSNPLYGRGREGFDAFTVYEEGAMIYDYAPTYNIVRYIGTYLNYPMAFASVDSSLEEVQAMPAFPAQGSIKFVGEKVVVKLS